VALGCHADEGRVGRRGPHERVVDPEARLLVNTMRGLTVVPHTDEIARVKMPH